jgi:hypothetical protein
MRYGVRIKYCLPNSMGTSSSMVTTFGGLVPATSRAVELRIAAVRLDSGLA